ncbi:ABC transporter permease [Embleya sp. NBC_00888]|uniref:ABC transporter permease n=1 Tax=Embleya sp. NBC_00888 TaxID=2975960 RepID=UPI00386D693D|nr:ABC transporter permease [Embleya sp. NBC_00888]
MENYSQLSDLLDAYQLPSQAGAAVDEAYEAFRQFHGPFITAVTAQMLPDLQRDAEAGRTIVFLGRDGHSFAAAAQALAPDFFAAHCRDVVLSRLVADAALLDLEAQRGAQFPEVEQFRFRKKQLPPEEIPGAFRQLTAYLRAAGIPIGHPDSAVTLVDSSFKGTVQELLTAAYPQTDFQGRYAFFGTAPFDARPHKKLGYVVHLSAEQTGEGRGVPLAELPADPALTFATQEAIYSIEDTLHGALGSPIGLSAQGPVQQPQRHDPLLRGYNPLLVPDRFRSPMTREAVKAAALLAVRDAAVEAAAMRGRPEEAGWLKQNREGFTSEVRKWIERSPQTDPRLKTVLDSFARRVDHKVISKLQDHLAARGIAERDALHLWEQVERAPTHQARADLVDTLTRQTPPSSAAAARSRSTTVRKPTHPDRPAVPKPAEQPPHLRRPRNEPGRGQGPQR